MTLDIIEHHDANSRYSLWYHHNLPLNHVSPMMNLDRLLWICNQSIKHGPGSPIYQLSELARLCRVNWIVQDLNRHGRINKPLLLQVNAFNLTTAQGDTRLMAAELCPQVHTAPALVSITDQYRGFFYDWKLIHSSDQLTDLLGFERDCIILRENKVDWVDHAIDWIEFSSNQTAHHMHDEHQRERMITNYINAQHANFVFTRAWCTDPIDWASWDY